MIKKLITISTAIVLGSMLTTASFAWPASPDCKNARADAKSVIEFIQGCKNPAPKGPWECDSISHADASACKRACAAVRDAICPDGAYPNPVPVPSIYEDCDNCVDFIESAPKSCQEIKVNDPAAGDGIYEIDPDGEGSNEPFDVYCDMTHEGGGWTLLKEEKNTDKGTKAHAEIDDKGLIYQEVFFKSFGSHKLDYLKPYDDNRWDSDGFNFAINYFRLSGDNYFVNPPVWPGCGTLPNIQHLPLAAFNILEPSSVCYFGSTNYLSYCAKSFILSLPTDKKLEAFGDLESTTNQCAWDNGFIYDYQIYVR